MRYDKDYVETVTRQEALYRFLLSRGDRWTSMEQTTDSIKQYPCIFRTTYHNSGARRLLTRDIEEINASDLYPKVIISGSKGIKLANEDEFEEFIMAELAEIFRKLKRVRRVIKKGRKDQQIDLEGEIREAFIGDGNG